MALSCMWHGVIIKVAWECRASHGFPEREGALLEALHRWAVVLPHMMLFHCCEGFDMERELKVSLSTVWLSGHVRLQQHAYFSGSDALTVSALRSYLVRAPCHALFSNVTGESSKDGRSVGKAWQQLWVHVLSGQ